VFFYLLERSQVRISLEPHLCFFNLILARRGMHVGMRFAGRGNEKDSAGVMGMAEKDSTWMRMTEHGMTAYPLPS
jgi:hypothetical protein